MKDIYFEHKDINPAEIANHWANFMLKNVCGKDKFPEIFSNSNFDISMQAVSFAPLFKDALKKILEEIITQPLPLTRSYKNSAGQLIQYTLKNRDIYYSSEYKSPILEEAMEQAARNSYLQLDMKDIKFLASVCFDQDLITRISVENNYAVHISDRDYIKCDYIKYSHMQQFAIPDPVITSNTELYNAINSSQPNSLFNAYSAQTSLATSMCFITALIALYRMSGKRWLGFFSSKSNNDADANNHDLVAPTFHPETEASALRQ